MRSIVALVPHVESTELNQITTASPAIRLATHRSVANRSGPAV